MGSFAATLKSMYWAAFDGALVAANAIKTIASVGKTQKDITCLHRWGFRGLRVCGIKVCRKAAGHLWRAAALPKSYDMSRACNR